MWLNLGPSLRGSSWAQAYVARVGPKLRWLDLGLDRFDLWSWTDSFWLRFKPTRVLGLNRLGLTSAHANSTSPGPVWFGSNWARTNLYLPGFELTQLDLGPGQIGLTRARVDSARSRPGWLSSIWARSTQLDLGPGWLSWTWSRVILAWLGPSRFDST